MQPLTKRRPIIDEIVAIRCIVKVSKVLWQRSVMGRCLPQVRQIDAIDERIDSVITPKRPEWELLVVVIRCIDDMVALQSRIK